MTANQKNFFDNKYQAMAESIFKLFDVVDAKDAKGWKMLDLQLPQNPISGTVYSGLNQLYLLSLMIENNYVSPFFLTPVQIKKEGGYMLKGSKAIWLKRLIHSFKFKGKKTSEAQMKELFKKQNEFKSFWGWINNCEDCEAFPGTKFFQVFPVSQTSLADKYTTDVYTPIEHNFDDVDLEISNLVESLKAKKGLNINIQPSNRAFYNFNEDYVTIPEAGQYEEMEVYNSILFHELAHWTGAPDRLGRKLGGNKESQEYAFEELVAEFTSFLLCAHFGISKAIERGTALYLKGWLAPFKNDMWLFNDVIRKADQAKKFILN